MSKLLYLVGKHGSIIGNYAIVDDNLHDQLSKYKWFVAINKKSSGNHKLYVKAKIKNKNYYLHRFILNITDPKIMIDHKDNNTFNNTIDNLRVTDSIKNMGNSKGYKKSTSASLYKGVQKNVKSGKWIASIGINYELFYIGSYKTDIEAAIAYDLKAIEIFGEHALLNFPENDYTKIQAPTKLEKKIGKTGERFIHYYKHIDRYQVKIEMKNKRHHKNCHTLSEAILYRNQYLATLEKNNE